MLFIGQTADFFVVARNLTEFQCNKIFKFSSMHFYKILQIYYLGCKKSAQNQTSIET